MYCIQLFMTLTYEDNLKYNAIWQNIKILKIAHNQDFGHEVNSNKAKSSSGHSTQGSKNN